MIQSIFYKQDLIIKVLLHVGIFFMLFIVCFIALSNVYGINPPIIINDSIGIDDNIKASIIITSSDQTSISDSIKPSMIIKDSSSIDDMIKARVIKP